VGEVRGFNDRTRSDDVMLAGLKDQLADFDRKKR